MKQGLGEMDQKIQTQCSMLKGKVYTNLRE